MRAGLVLEGFQELVFRILHILVQLPHNLLHDRLFHVLVLERHSGAGSGQVRLRLGGVRYL